MNCCCKRERRDEENGECGIVHFLDFPGPWNNSKNKIGVAIDVVTMHDTCISNTSMCVSESFKLQTKVILN